MNSKGNLPEEQHPGVRQSITVRTRDNSPVTVNAPHAHATAGGTAAANLRQPAQPPAPTEPSNKPWWRSGLLLWTIVIALGTLAILYFTIVPGHK